MSYTVAQIKALGKEHSKANLNLLIRLFESYAPEERELPVEVRREIVSSIGRQEDVDRIYRFIKEHMYDSQPMDVIYQMFRTVLYLEDGKQEGKRDLRFTALREEMEKFYNNSTLERMKNYYWYKTVRRNRKQYQPHHEQGKIEGGCQIIQGDAAKILNPAETETDLIRRESIQLVFTSPPYYNAREYVNYKNYEEYLQDMKRVFQGCYNVLEAGRFLIVNVSPVIEKRPGREFESTRYPIHYDFHRILQEAGFYFVDEIYWIKPEPSVPNRIGGYLQTRKPLGYKPNCVTESLMVYRKKCSFLLDEIMSEYPEYDRHEDEEVDTSNCWYIAPKADKDHPAVFPEELCRRVLKYYSYEGDTVMDPFAGSGTVGVVAKYMKRQAVLIEREKKYVDIIRKKLIRDVRE